MKKKSVNLLLIALLLLNIMDGDFSSFSVLDFVKLLLIIFCFLLNNRKED